MWKYENQDESVNIPKSMFTVREPKIHRCKYCKAIIRRAIGRRLYLKSYCSEWCYEMEHLPEVKNLKSLCADCGIIMNPIPRKNGINSGMYRKRCADCKEKKHLLALERIKNRYIKVKNRNY